MEKFLNYSDDEMKELKEFLKLHFSSMQELARPALDLVTPEFIEKHSNQFLRERRAAYLLDKDAQERGFESAAHEYVAKEQKRLDEEAQVLAAQLAKKKADEEELQKIAEKEAAEAKLLQEQRDEQDAQNAALLKAQRDAIYKGLSNPNL